MRIFLSNFAGTLGVGILWAEDEAIHLSTKCIQCALHRAMEGQKEPESVTEPVLSV